MRWRLPLLLLCAWLAQALAPPCRADERGARADLRQAVVFKLLLFVDWPQDAARAHPELFRFCVLDEGGPGSAMAELDGKRLGERTLTVLHVGRDAEALRRCHAIFIDAGNRRSLAGVAAGTRQASVLVIAEGDQAIQEGATIGLSTAGGRIAFDINLAAARAANLAISSKLLRIARSVFE